MKLYPFRWELEGGKNINKVKQFFEDMSSSSEKYWSEEGNNKRMQSYYKFSKYLKVFEHIITLALVSYILYLCTTSLFCMFDKMSCVNNMEILDQFNFKTMVFNTYKITFIITVLLVIYYSRKNKYTIKKVVSSLFNGLLFLPISVLLIYNFMMLGSLMISFYLLVVFVVITFVTNSISNRIDNLHDIAVGSIEVEKNRKGDKKLCKGK